MTFLELFDRSRVFGLTRHFGRLDTKVRCKKQYDAKKVIRFFNYVLCCTSLDVSKFLLVVEKC